MRPTPQPASQEPGAEACPRCGVIDRPTLTQGSGPHALRAECVSCGTFLRWVSLLSPSERLARRMKAKLEAMMKYPPSEAQLLYLRKLGDLAVAPETMAAASERIEALKRGKQ